MNKVATIEKCDSQVVGFYSYHEEAMEKDLGEVMTLNALYL